jgi:soluble lytic murein transglycosylase-like protein
MDQGMNATARDYVYKHPKFVLQEQDHTRDGQYNREGLAAMRADHINAIEVQ